MAADRLDVIGSDHAPHTWAQKQMGYREAPSGLPLVQHALPALLELVADRLLPITTLVAKTCHRVAELFAVPDRGYLREGYWADLVLIKPEPEGKPVSSSRSWPAAAGRPSPNAAFATASAPSWSPATWPGTTAKWSIAVRVYPCIFCVKREA